MKRFSSFIQKRRASRAAKQQQQPQQQQQQQPISASAEQPKKTGESEGHAEVKAAPQDLVEIETASSLTIALQNQTNSNTVYAYITGIAIDNGNRLVLMRSDGVTPYYPASPSSTIQPLGADCAIRLGSPGSTILAQIPRIAGGRIWFSINRPLQFFLNPGPALVEPSVSNPSDPNIQTTWDFAEFTFNSAQLYANITYVDFVSIPIALTLETSNSGTSHVSGMGPSGLQQVADGLRQQHATDGKGWDQLIVNQNGTNTPLRILSPVQGLVRNPNLFADYFDGYVDQVYQRYQSTPLRVDTQAAAGVVSGTSNGNNFYIGGANFPQPSTRDIFGCSTGPFQTGNNPTVNAIIPRLAAAFNRSTLLITNLIPTTSNNYYKNYVTNHYSRIVHSANLDGKGYAFPYDDVQPTGGADQSGAVYAGDPKIFTLAVGGNNAHV